MVNNYFIRVLTTALLCLQPYTAQAVEQVKAISENAPNSVVPISSGETSLSGEPKNLASPSDMQNLLQYALSFDGANYRRGGENPVTGFDCSGFVRYVFHRVGEVQLPHSANAIGQLGSAVQRSEFLPGDLVFFRRGKRKVSHVGIYLGDNQFIHAASRRTGRVLISSLADRYWASHFIFGRRITLKNQSSQKFEDDSLLEPSNLNINSADK